MSAARVVLRYSDGGMLVEQDGELVVIEPAPTVQDRVVDPLEYCDRCGDATDEEPDGYARACEKCQGRHHGAGAPSLWMVGKRFGLVVITGRSITNAGPDGVWLLRCDCGREDTARTRELNLDQKSMCTHCKLERQRGPAGRVEWAEHGKCSWCGGPSETRARASKTGSAYECIRHTRMAHRNGRQPDGRPIARYEQRAVSRVMEVLAACGGAPSPGSAA